MAFAVLNFQTGVVEIISWAVFAKLAFLFHSNGDTKHPDSAFSNATHVKVPYVDTESLSETLSVAYVRIQYFLTIRRRHGPIGRRDGKGCDWSL